MTHLPNELALKMDGAQAWYLYVARSKATKDLLRSYPASQGRLTRVQSLFARNLSPLQSSKFSFEYLLLPPRSALGAASPGIAPGGCFATSTPSYSLGHRICPKGRV